MTRYVPRVGDMVPGSKFLAEGAGYYDARDVDALVKTLQEELAYKQVILEAQKGIITVQEIAIRDLGRTTRYRVIV